MKVSRFLMSAPTQTDGPNDSAKGALTREDIPELVRLIATELKKAEPTPHPCVDDPLEGSSNSSGKSRLLLPLCPLLPPPAPPPPWLPQIFSVWLTLRCSTMCCSVLRCSVLLCCTLFCSMMLCLLRASALRSQALLHLRCKLLK